MHSQSILLDKFQQESAIMNPTPSLVTPPSNMHESIFEKDYTICNTLNGPSRISVAYNFFISDEANHFFEIIYNLKD